MASDLFHEVARAYYGVSPELYAAGCAVDQYAGIADVPPQNVGESSYALGDARTTGTGTPVEPDDTDVSNEAVARDDLLDSGEWNMGRHFDDFKETGDMPPGPSPSEQRKLYASMTPRQRQAWLSKDPMAKSRIEATTGKLDYSITGTGTRIEPESKNSLPSEEADISPEKAKKILEDGEVNGHPLTEAQRKMFGAIAAKAKDKYAAVPPPPPPPSPKARHTVDELPAAIAKLQGTGIKLSDLSNPPSPANAPTPTPPKTPAAPAPTPAPKRRVPESMRMAAARLQSQYNKQQRIPPSSRPWT